MDTNKMTDRTQDLKDTLDRAASTLTQAHQALLEQADTREWLKLVVGLADLQRLEIQRLGRLVQAGETLYERLLMTQNQLVENHVADDIPVTMEKNMRALAEAREVGLDVQDE